MRTHAVIVGGGPNGLLMACELGLAGIRAIVLERLHEPSTMPKANGLVGQVVQALDYRGLYHRLTGNDQPPRPVPGFQFGGLALSDCPIYMLPVPQRRIEEILEKRAAELGAEIRRGHEAAVVRQDADRVTVEVKGPSGWYRLASDYLVAADGGHSAIRKQLGIAFPGITDDSVNGLIGQASILPPAAQTGTGDLEIPGIGRLRNGTFTRTEKGVFGFGMFQPSVYRFGIFEHNGPRVDESVPVSVSEASEIVSRVLGTRIEIAQPPDSTEMTLRRMSGGGNSRQADQYRIGRIFLVGDAAHVHSGVGGPGLNLGMQDVINLGWKLGAQMRGWAPGDLLDTYQTERHPVGERVIMQTRAQSALFAPGPYVTALRKVFEELLRNRDNVRHIGAMIAGTDIRYSMGSEAGEAHWLTGRRMPDLVLQTGNSRTRVAELMRAGKPVLLNLTNNSELLQAASGWADRVDRIQVTADGTAAAILIRPDGYVAWATDTSGAAEGLQDALEEWFGSPKSISGRSRLLGHSESSNC